MNKPQNEGMNFFKKNSIIPNINISAAIELMNLDRISYMNSDIDSNNPKWHKKDHKIKRLRKKQEQKLSTREYTSYLKELRLYDDGIATINRKKY